MERIGCSSSSQVKWTGLGAGMAQGSLLRCTEVWRHTTHMHRRSQPVIRFVRRFEKRCSLLIDEKGHELNSNIFNLFKAKSSVGNASKTQNVVQNYWNMSLLEAQAGLSLSDLTEINCAGFERRCCTYQALCQRLLFEHSRRSWSQLVSGKQFDLLRSLMG